MNSTFNADEMIAVVEMSERCGLSPHEWSAIVATNIAANEPTGAYAAVAATGPTQTTPLSPEEYREALLSTVPPHDHRTVR